MYTRKPKCRASLNQCAKNDHNDNVRSLLRSTFWSGTNCEDFQVRHSIGRQANHWMKFSFHLGKTGIQKSQQE